MLSLARGQPTGNFTWNPPTPSTLAGGNVSFTATVSGGTPPYQLVWAWADGTPSTSSHTGRSGSFALNTTIPSSSHSTTTSVTCNPGSIPANALTTCAVTVRDIASSPTTPTGPVTLATNGTGTFSPSNTCTLFGSGATSSCQVTYSPTLAVNQAITAVYNPDSGHVGISSGKFTLFVTTPGAAHSTTTSVSCNPGSVNVGVQTTCTATVTDSSSSPTNPIGTATFSNSSAGTFAPYFQCGLSAGPTLGTASCSVAYTPTTIGSTGTDVIKATYSGNSGMQVTHIFSTAGNFTVSLTITDFPGLSTTIPHTVWIRGSPLNINGWSVNWNITATHGIEISNVTYGGVLTIRDALINGILVRYFQQPPSLSCLFFDDLGKDDIASSIAGLSAQFSSGPDPWFQIRAQYNPSGVGYNYTQDWRFYSSGRWDAILYVGHTGCGWNHTYQPHFRISLAIGNKNTDLMSQYTPSGVWQNLVWEGNYTDNGLRDRFHNFTQWRFGDGRAYYYVNSTVIPLARDMPSIASKIYLVRDQPGELEPNINPPPTIPDPIVFANGQLAYRQSIAFWYLPTFGDHWLYSVGSPPVGQPSLVDLSFYPNGI